MDFSSLTTGDDMTKASYSLLLIGMIAGTILLPMMVMYMMKKKPLSKGKKNFMMFLTFVIIACIVVVNGMSFYRSMKQ
jgi:hypothetical protein